MFDNRALDVPHIALCFAIFGSATVTEQVILASGSVAGITFKFT
jgi:hypothetical protein